MVNRSAFRRNDCQTAVKSVRCAERSGQIQRLIWNIVNSVIRACSDIELIIARSRSARSPGIERGIAGNVGIHRPAPAERNAEVVYIQAFVSVILPLLLLIVVILVRFITANALVLPIITGANAGVAPLHTGAGQEARRRDNVVNHVKLIVKSGVPALVIDAAVNLDNRPKIVNLRCVCSILFYNRF